MNFQLRFSPTMLPLYDAIQKNLLGDLTGSGNDKEGLEKILEKNPNLSRQLSSQLSQNNFSNMIGNIPGFMKKK